MPKIRSGIKNPYTKSGSVTKTFKNVIKEHDSNQGFYPTNKFTTGFKLDDFNQIFDDTNTIDTTSKSVNHVFGIESTYKSTNNKLIHSPSTFDTNDDFLVTKEVEIENYDNTLPKNNFSIQYTPYVDNYLNTNNNSLTNIQNSAFDESSYNVSDQVSIEIELNFDAPAILQNNEFYVDDFTKKVDSISFDNGSTKWIAKNNPVAYFNFKEKSWEYVLNSHEANPPNTNTYNTDSLVNEAVSKSNIGFSPSYNPYKSNYKVNTIGVPCFNSKFPIGEQWYASEDTLLKMSDYITNDFILEKVIFVCNKTTSKCQKNNYKVYDGSNNEISITNTYEQNNQMYYLSNSLNFFILNQKTEQFNPYSFWEGSGFDSEKKYINNMFFDKSGSDTSLNLKTSVVNDYIGGNSIDKGYYIYDNSSLYNGQVGEKEKSLTTKSSAREIVSVNNFFIYNKNFGNQETVSLLNKIKNEDYIDNSLEIVNNDDINFENQKLEISSDCKIPNASNIHSTHFLYINNNSTKVYSSNYLGGRDLQSNDFGRNFFNRRSSKIDTSSTFTVDNNEITELKNKFYKSPYILKPEDKLIFGVNSYTNGNILPYILMLEKSVKVVLVGRHVVNDKKKINKKQSIISNNVIKTVISEPICDEWDVVPTESIYNGIYDNIYNNEDRYTTQGKILDREVYGKVSSKQFGSFNNTVKLFSDEEKVIYDTVMPNTLSYYKNSGNISTSFDNIRLSYEEDSNHNNSNHQWINSYPFEDRFKSIHEKRDVSLDLKDSGINKFNIKVDKYFLPNECFQYYKKDTKFGSYESGTILKNIRGYIETETLTDESILYYLDQGKSISTAVPTNVFADVLINNNIPYIIRMQGDIFDIEKDFVGEGQMPDTLKANSGRIVFYNTNIESDSDITFNFKNIANPNSEYQKFLPYKIIARLGSTQSGNIDRNSSQTTSASFTNTYDFSHNLSGGVDSIAYNFSLNASSNNSNEGYYPLLENTTVLGYDSNDFYQPDVLEKLNKVFFGFEKVKGKSYRHYPLIGHDGWKYGIYNSKKTSLSYNFNWKSYGQFKDKSYGSINTTLYRNDSDIEWPIVKKFINKNYYSVNNQDSSITTTFNKDYHARSNYPFIENSIDSLSGYYTS